MADISNTIIPRSDQLNAEDLLTGPRTFTITEVRVKAGEQPVEITLAEFDKGRPWKPGLTSRKTLASAWGTESDNYIGRRVTLFTDPDVTWGKERVGGIRISHMSDIPGPIDLALSEKKGKRKVHHIEPLPAAKTTAKQTPPPASEADQLRADILAECNARGILPATVLDGWLSDHDEDMRTTTNVDGLRAVLDGLRADA